MFWRAFVAELRLACFDQNAESNRSQGHKRIAIINASGRFDDVRGIDEALGAASSLTTLADVRAGQISEG